MGVLLTSLRIDGMIIEHDHPLSSVCVCVGGGPTCLTYSRESSACDAHAVLDEGPLCILVVKWCENCLFIVF